MSRVRSLLLAVTLVAVGLLTTVGVAAADDYVPPSITVQPTTSSVSPPPVPQTSPEIQVQGVSSSVNGPLAETGAGMNLGLAVTIGGIVLLLGVGLVVVGSRLSRRRADHS